MTHYRSSGGQYIGSFGNGAQPPEGAVGCPAPEDAAQTWDGSRWVTDPVAALTDERAGMVVSRFQAKAALLQAGHLSAVEAAIANADSMTQLAWAEAMELRRNSPMIAALAGAIGLTDAEVDDLFRAAAQVEA